MMNIKSENYIANATLPNPLLYATLASRHEFREIYLLTLNYGAQLSINVTPDALRAKDSGVTARLYGFID